MAVCQSSAAAPAAGRIRLAMGDQHTSLCMGGSAMLAWFTGFFLHDIYPALTAFTAIGGTLLTIVGIYRLGRDLVRRIQGRAPARDEVRLD